MLLPPPPLRPAFLFLLLGGVEHGARANHLHMLLTAAAGLRIGADAIGACEIEEQEEGRQTDGEKEEADGESDGCELHIVRGGVS